MRTQVAYADWHGAAVATAPTMDAMTSLYNRLCRRAWRPRHVGFQQAENGFFVWFTAPHADVGRFYV